MNTIMTIRNLEFSYEDTAGAEPLLAIDNLSIEAGRIIVLIGDNGCGKTTLLKLIAGLLKTDTGKISMTGPAPVLVHQRPYLFAESVQANVGWPLRIRRFPREAVRARVAEALDEVRLSHLSRRWAPSLSGGEKQRAALARALVLRPQVLLLDEPTSNIDAASVATVEKVLATRAASGTTVIMSTHNLASAYRLADTVLPMEAGRLVPLRVNILRGQSLDAGDSHIGLFRTDSGQEIFCPATVGDRSRAVIRMDDIILSRNEITSSALNHLKGTVVTAEDAGHELVAVTLDCGFPVKATVTGRSMEELGIRPGATVIATFKASAVALY